MSEGGTEKQPFGGKLISILLLEAAYRMEDSAPVLVRAWPADRFEQAARIAMPALVAGDRFALAKVASVLHREPGEHGTNRS